MALTKCPECRGVVSEQAAACPHCGHPVAATTPRARALFAVMLSVLIAGAALAAAASRGDFNRFLPFVVTGAAVVLFVTFLALKRRST